VRPDPFDGRRRRFAVGGRHRDRARGTHRHAARFARQNGKAQCRGMRTSTVDVEEPKRAFRGLRSSPKEKDLDRTATARESTWARVTSCASAGGRARELRRLPAAIRVVSGYLVIPPAERSEEDLLVCSFACRAGGGILRRRRQCCLRQIEHASLREPHPNAHINGKSSSDWAERSRASSSARPPSPERARVRIEAH